MESPPLRADHHVLSPALSATIGFGRHKPGEETSQAGTANPFFIKSATFRALDRKGKVPIQIGQGGYQQQASQGVKNKVHRRLNGLTNHFPMTSMTIEWINGDLP
ncbi:hypothetical protein [Spirosoma aerophilum]